MSTKKSPRSVARNKYQERKLHLYLSSEKQKEKHSLISTAGYKQTMD